MDVATVQFGGVGKAIVINAGPKVGGNGNFRKTMDFKFRCFIDDKVKVHNTITTINVKTRERVASRLGEKTIGGRNPRIKITNGFVKVSSIALSKGEVKSFYAWTALDRGGIEGVVARNGVSCAVPKDTVAIIDIEFLRLALVDGEV